MVSRFDVDELRVLSDSTFEFLNIRLFGRQIEHTGSPLQINANFAAINTPPTDDVMHGNALQVTIDERMVEIGARVQNLC